MKALDLKGFGDISSGDRAAIYQHISRLEGYFLPTTRVTILLNDSESSKNEGLRVELSVAEGGGTITAIGHGENVLDAVEMACDMILAQFIKLQKAMQKEMEKAADEDLEEIEQDIDYKRDNWH